MLAAARSFATAALVAAPRRQGWGGVVGVSSAVSDSLQAQLQPRWQWQWHGRGLALWAKGNDGEDGAKKQEEEETGDQAEAAAGETAASIEEGQGDVPAYMNPVLGSAPSQGGGAARPSQRERERVVVDGLRDPVGWRRAIPTRLRQKRHINARYGPHNPLFSKAYQDAKGSVWKLSRVARLIRYLPVPEAVAQLKFSRKRSAAVYLELIEEACEEAQKDLGLGMGDLEVARAYVTKGKTVKKIRYHGKGRAGMARRKWSHVNVSVKAADPEGRIAQAIDLNDDYRWGVWTRYRAARAQQSDVLQSVIDGAIAS